MFSLVLFLLQADSDCWTADCDDSLKCANTSPAGPAATAALATAVFAALVAIFYGL